MMKVSERTKGGRAKDGRAKKESRVNKPGISITTDETRLFQELYLLVFDLNKPATLQEIFDKSLAGMLDVLNVERASLLTFDDDKVMRFRAWHNISDSYRKAVEGHTPWEAGDPDPQPVLISDVMKDANLADYRTLFERESIRALAFIPLLDQNRLIGKFMLYYDMPHTFSEKEVHLAQTVAGHVAPAVERLQARQSLLNYAHQQSFLARLGQQALKSYYRLPELMDEIVQQAAEILEADLCELLKLEPDGTKLRLIAGTGWKEGTVGRTLVEAGRRSQAGYTMERQLPVVVEDLGDETRFEIPPLLQVHGAVSGMTVVVEGGERPFGILGVYSTSVRRFTQDEVNFLHVLANILATAILQNQALLALQSVNDFLEERVAKRTLLLNQEIAQREQAEEALQRESDYIRLLQEVAETANEAHSIEDGFRVILDKICDFTSWPLAHVYIQASELFESGHNDELVSSGVWRCSDHEGFELFKQITSETRIRRGAGWVGYVFESGKSAWIMSVSEEQDQQRSKQLQAINIKAGFAFPVMVGEEVTAVMEFFTPEFQEPEKELLGVMAQIGTQMGRIVERERARKQIKRNERNLRELAGRLVRTQEEERRRISHDLHDDIGQTLSALKLELDMLAADVEDEGLKEQLGRARRVAKVSLERMQLLAYDLRPPELDTIGLDAALQDLCRDIAQRAAFIVKYEGTDHIPADISDPIKLSIYRALQEGLSNAAKHSGASWVNVRLSYQDGEVSLSVTDNGRGLPQKQDAAIPNFGLGLLGLSERFARLGGSVSITSNENEGTTLLVVVSREE